MSNLSDHVPLGVNVVVTAGEALSIRDCVYVAAATGGGVTAGKAYKADADAIRQSTGSFWCGFATAAISANATGTIRVAGVLTGFTLTAGAPQYVSATAGALTETAPTYARIVGIALDTTNLLINTRGANTVIAAAGSKGYVSGTAADGRLITFSSDTSSTLTTNAILGQGAGISEGITKGYWLGAAGGNPAAYKVTFSSNTNAAATTANLSQGRQQLSGMNADSTKGYACGGWTGANVATTDKVTYSSDTTAAATAANLSSTRRATKCVNNYGIKGYCAGGVSAAACTTTDKVTYSNDTTVAATTANLSGVKGFHGGVSEGTTKGYFGGGDSNAAGAAVATTDKVTFSSDTTAAVTTANLAVIRCYFASNSEGSTKGYWSGGYTAATWAATAQTDKTTFSTDVTAACTTANVVANGWFEGMSDIAV